MFVKMRRVPGLYRFTGSVNRYGARFCKRLGGLTRAAGLSRCCIFVLHLVSSRRLVCLSVALARGACATARIGGVAAIGAPRPMLWHSSETTSSSFTSTMMRSQVRCRRPSSRSLKPLPARVERYLLSLGVEELRCVRLKPILGSGIAPPRGIYRALRCGELAFAKTRRVPRR